MAEAPTKLTAKIVMLGSQIDIDALMRDLNVRNYLSQAREITLVIGYWDELTGSLERDALEALLTRHAVVQAEKSETTLTTKRKISDSAGDEPEAKAAPETPLERAIREAAPSIEHVTLGTGTRSVTLTAQTARNAAQMLNALHDEEE